MGSVPVWTCPLCREALVCSVSNKSWSCDNSHLFDCAREGYVNLLSLNKKRSSEPGDNAEMIGARRRIHTADIYWPLAEAIQAISTGLDSIKRIFDLGCGEGYYSGAVQRAKPEAQLCAVDISKTAIRLAAKKYRAVHFAVASTFELPAPSNSQDLLLRIFSPADDNEIHRVLAEKGFYLEVTPAPQHLWALREALYGMPRAHAISRREIPGLKLCQGSTVEFDVELDQTLLRDLVAMTPFAHRGHREKRRRLLARDMLSLQMAFSLNLFQK